MSSFRKSNHAIQQMNSELQRAQLELLSAHCAVHQLRLHYSSDDLARFGRRDVLRKSAEAAGALHDFYRTIQSKLPESEQSLTAFQATAEQIATAIEWVAGYLREQRGQYSPIA